MRLPVLVLFIFQFIVLHAQMDFEGMIRYRGVSGIQGPRFSDAGHPDTAEVKIYFTPGKILILTNKGAEESEERTLVLLDSARTYLFDMKDRKYRVKKLKVIERIEANPERIAGYMATPFSGGLGISDQLGGINATLWFADSLFFNVPEKFEGNDELLMVKNNHILLKAFINMGDYGSLENDQPDNSVDAVDVTINAITLEAIEIVHGKINPSEFEIPHGFVEWSYNSVSPDTVYSDITDSVVSKVDTAVTIPAIEPAKTKQTKPTQSKTSKTKTETKPGFRKED